MNLPICLGEKRFKKQLNQKFKQYLKKKNSVILKKEKLGRKKINCRALNKEKQIVCNKSKIEYYVTHIGKYINCRRILK